VDLGLLATVLGGVAGILGLVYMVLFGQRSITEWWHDRRQRKAKSENGPKPEEDAVASDKVRDYPTHTTEHYSRIEIQFLQEQLRTHKKNLGRLDTERARYGIDTPLTILNAIEWEEKKIEEMQMRLNEMSAADLPQPAAFHNLPPRVEFVGRAREKAKVLQALNSRSYIVAIKGIGGIGKSCLALEVAYDCLHKALFWGGVWNSAKREQELTLEVLLNDVAETLDYLYVIRLPLQDRLREIRRLLRSVSCLLIIDDFDMITDEAIVDFLLALPEPSKALITSRHRDIQQAWVIPLEGMEQDEALALIRGEGRQLGFTALAKANDAELIPLYEAAGGVPLAMKWAVGQIAQEGQELDTVLDSLRRGKADMFESVFLRSYEMLTLEAQRILLTMSVFDAPVARETLEYVIDTSHLAFAIDDGLRQLVRMSLIRASEELQTRCYNLHPLTHSFASAQLQDDPQLARKIYQRFYEYQKRSDTREVEKISLKAVIFDLYDTLVYFDEADYINTKSEMARRVGADEDAFLTAWRHYRRASAIGDIATMKDRVVHSLKKLGIKADEPAIDELCELERQLQEEKCRLFNATEAILKNLSSKGLKLGLIAHCSSAAKNVLDVLSIKKHFDQVTFTFAEGMLKPDPRLFSLTAERLGVEPDECLYIGDGNDEELDGAHAVGMKTVLIARKQTPLWRQEQSRYFDYKITNLMDIKQIIKDINWTGAMEENEQ
jgi:HAD superfamily hydrolase (TIGR01509 family)